jgi:alpha-tubulin suppressor-like RCC1 family protein
MVCTEDGDVFSWGQGRHGALGTGRTTNEYSPAIVNLSQACPDQGVVPMALKISCG